MQTFPVPSSLQNVRPSLPDNAFTVEQYAEHYKLPYATAIKRLTGMINSGQVISGRFLSASNGRTCTKNYYLPQPSGKTKSSQA